MGSLALAIAVAGCGNPDDHADREYVSQPDEIRACLEAGFIDACRVSNPMHRQLQAAAAHSAAARCQAFMKSTPPPKPDSPVGMTFWPDSPAGRYHENLLTECGDLWAAVQMRDSDAVYLAIAGTSATQFFEHCLGSMSQRKLSSFETKLYCLNIYVPPDSLFGQYPSEYWAYTAYRTGTDRNAEWFRTVATSICQQFGTNEACNDAKAAQRN